MTPAGRSLRWRVRRRSAGAKSRHKRRKNGVLGAKVLPLDFHTPGSAITCENRVFVLPPSVVSHKYITLIACCFAALPASARPFSPSDETLACSLLPPGSDGQSCRIFLVKNRVGFWDASQRKGRSGSTEPKMDGCDSLLSRNSFYSRFVQVAASGRLDVRALLYTTSSKGPIDPERQRAS